jgi:hypothetical protein
MSTIIKECMARTKPNSSSERPCYNNKRSLLLLYLKVQKEAVTMVKVWYQPPPYGVGTDLNRSGYGVPKGTSRLLEKLAKTNPLIVYPTGVLFFTILACIPGCKFT